MKIHYDTSSDIVTSCTHSFMIEIEGDEEFVEVDVTEVSYAFDDPSHPGHFTLDETNVDEKLLAGIKMTKEELLNALIEELKKQ